MYEQLSYQSYNKKGVDNIASMLAPEIVTAIKENLPVMAFAVVDESVAVGTLGGVPDGNSFEIISIKEFTDAVSEVKVKTILNEDN